MEIISSKSLILFLTLVVALTTTSNGFIINGFLVGQVRILGLVTCDLPPPPPPPEARPILNGTNVALVCAGSRADLASTLADVNGFYELVVNSLDAIVFDPSQCRIVVRLPIARCRIFPPTGTLRATFSLVSILQPIFNVVAIFTAGPLRLVT